MLLIHVLYLLISFTSFTVYPATPEINQDDARANFIANAAISFALGSKLDHPYDTQIAHVRLSNDIPEEEKAACTLRKQKAHKKLEQLLGISLEPDEFPTIALCCSGGGYRALISTLGMLMALEEMDLLDCVTYIAGVSGSTWTMGTWYSHKKKLIDLKNLLKEQIKKPLPSDSSYTKLLELASIKYYYDQKFTLVDIWGALIAKTLLSDFGDKRQSCHLSEQQHSVSTGLCPFPIYTSIIPLDKTYEWVEHTPYEVTNIAQNAAIPTWSLGRKFDSGISMDFAPEQTLGFLLGACGSAFTISEGEFLDMYAQQLPFLLVHTLNFLNTYTSFEYARISPAQLYNPLYGTESILHKNKQEICLVDAGIDCNLPFPPLLRAERKIDIIIVADASSDIDTGSEIACGEEYAIKNNLLFPPISYTDISKQTVSVFADLENKAPTILYVPLIKNSAYAEFDPQESITSGGYCSTFNLSYKEEETEQLCGLTHFSVYEARAKIVQSLYDFCMHKKKVKQLLA